MSEPRDITALIADAARGDSTACELLLRDLEAPLRAFIAAKTRGRPDVDTDEILQDVRIYLLQRLHRYDAAYPLVVFARGLAWNIVKRHLYKNRGLLGAEEGETWSGDLSPLDLQPLHPTLRQVLGEDRFAYLDRPSAPSRLFLETLEVFFRYGGYPHQQAAFGFSVLVWGRAKRKSDGAGFEKVPVTGNPGRVVDEVGPRELDPACKHLVSEIGAGCGLDPAYLGRIAQPLEQRLRLTLAALFQRDRSSAKQFQHLLAERTGATRLADYLGPDGRRSVSDWTLTVKRRVQAAVADPPGRDWIPLPDERAEM